MLPPIITELSSLPLERQLTLRTVLDDIEKLDNLDEAKKRLSASIKQSEIYKANLGQVVKAYIRLEMGS